MCWDSTLLPIISDIPNNITYLTLYNDTKINIGMLPKNLKKLKLVNYREKIEPGVLPKKLKTLIFHGKYDYPIDPGVLPQKLKKLIINEVRKNEGCDDVEYEYKFIEGSLPQKLKYLKIYGKYKQIFDKNVLPPNLKYLKLKSYSGKFYKGSLPIGLKNLTIWRCSKNINIGTLPENLEYLKITHFDGMIDDYALPQSLNYIYLGSENMIYPTIQAFNSQLKNLKMLTLQDITFDIKSMEGYLFPNNLEMLSISFIPKYNIFPLSLLYLDIHNFDFNIDDIDDIAEQTLMVGNLSDNIKYLNISYLNNIKRNTLPTKLEHLIIDHFSGTIETNALPQSLKHLHLEMMPPIARAPSDWTVTISRDIFPENLESIKLSGNYILDGPNIFPQSIKSISFGDKFNQPLLTNGIKLLPNGLNSVVFGKRFNQPLIAEGMRLLPDGINEIIFGEDFNQPLFAEEMRLLPDGINKIVFGEKFDQSLIINKKSLLPINIIDIEFRVYLKFPIIEGDVKAFPESLRKIKFPYIPIRGGHKEIPHKAFHYDTSITCRGRNITPRIQKRILIDTHLPMPIAEEILYNF